MNLQALSQRRWAGSFFRPFVKILACANKHSTDYIQLHIDLKTDVVLFTDIYKCVVVSLMRKQLDNDEQTTKQQT